MRVDEQESEWARPPCGREATEQQGAVAPDDEWEVFVREDRCHRIPDARHHRCQATRIDEQRPGVALRRRIRERDVSVVVDVPVPSERLDETRLAKRCGRMSHAIDRPRRVRRHAEQSDAAMDRTYTGCEDASCTLERARERSS